MRKLTRKERKLAWIGLFCLAGWVYYVIGFEPLQQRLRDLEDSVPARAQELTELRSTLQQVQHGRAALSSASVQAPASFNLEEHIRQRLAGAQLAAPSIEINSKTTRQGRLVSTIVTVQLKGVEFAQAIAAIQSIDRDAPFISEPGMTLEAVEGGIDATLLFAVSQSPAI